MDMVLIIVIAVMLVTFRESVICQDICDFFYIIQRTLKNSLGDIVYIVDRSDLERG